MGVSCARYLVKLVHQNPQNDILKENTADRRHHSKKRIEAKFLHHQSSQPVVLVASRGSFRKETRYTPQHPNGVFTLQGSVIQVPPNHEHERKLNLSTALLVTKCRIQPLIVKEGMTAENDLEIETHAGMHNFPLDYINLQLRGDQ